MTRKEIQQIDAQHIWHPLTQHKTASIPLAIEKAQGNYLYDYDGNKYLDAISSWYTCSYGHAHTALTTAIKNQVERLHHVVFTGMTHEPAAILSKKLIGILPDNQEKLFFSENGSTSVEIALKMAFQYHFNRGEKRNVVIALENGFHGDTFGAMSASGLSVYNGPFKDFFIEVKRIPVPTDDTIEQVLSLIDDITNTHQVASFIYEPLVQGAAAMQMHEASCMNRLLLRFRESGIITIADEVMTGFGKTGSHFASDYIETKPDIICLAKALTGGIMPMAITSCTQQVYDAFYDDDLSKGFFHGHTYSGNPLGCAVAATAIDLLTSQEIQERIQYISQSHKSIITIFNNHKKVLQARSCGVILAIDLDIKMERYGNKRNEIFNWFMSRGIFLRPLGNTIYIVPPFTITDSQLEFLYQMIEEFLR